MDVPKLDIPSSVGPGAYFLECFFKFLCKSLLIVAEKTKVRIASLGAMALTRECLAVSAKKSSINGSSRFELVYHSWLVQSRSGSRVMKGTNV